MTRSNRPIAFLGVLTIAALLASGAQAQSRTWGVAGLEGDIFARDCVECDEDVGIVIACQGTGSNAAVAVPFAAAEQRPASGSAPISFRLDGETFTFEAGTEEQGMVGFVPTFTLRPNDPMVAALQSAGSARVTFEGRETRIGLRGSRDALEIFKAHCGWNGLVAVPAVPGISIAEASPRAPLVLFDAPAVAPAAQGVAVAPPVFDGPHWFTSQYESAEDGRPMMALTYGVPETDNVLLTASCVAGGAARSVLVDILVDVGAAADRDIVEAVVKAGGQTFNYTGDVFSSSSEYAGVRVEVGARAPFWKALKSGGDVRVGVDGGGLSTASSDGVAAAIDAFTGACFEQQGGTQAAVLEFDFGAAPKTPAKPLIELNFAIGNDPSIAPAPGAGTAPLVQLDFGGTPAPGLAAPAIVAANAPSATSYLCDDGSAIAVEIERSGSGNVAMLGVAGAEALTLPEVSTTFATKYADGHVTLRINGGTAHLAQGSVRQFCVQQ